MGKSRKENKTMPKLANYRQRETETYVYYNNNPKNRITGDCVVRSISLFTGKTYKETLLDLYVLSQETGYMLNDKKCYEKYLTKLGYVKMKQPRKSDNTKYLGYEWATITGMNDDICLCRIGGHHLTCIKNGKFHDIWNPSYKCVNNFWVKRPSRYFDI